ncbi:MAG: hypothetical protein ACT4O9_08950, partial [Blastocatellia bacterium]
SYRLLSFESLENEAALKGGPTLEPTHFRIVFYDYTRDIAVIAEGDYAGKESIRVSTDKFDPGVSGEEIEAAYSVINANPRLGPLSKEGKIDLSAAMPPVSNLNGERLVNILVQSDDGTQNQVVGISFKNSKVVNYEGNTPPTCRAAAAGGTCGISNSGQGSTGQGVAGQMQLTVNQTGTTNPLWEMLVIRPSSSSGASGERSGLEIRDVKYKGKTVLKRGHAPILNVQYVNNVCGPFRDWQYAEGFFSAPDAGAQNPAPGMRILAAGQIATTAVESRNDTGNFQGVAAYTQNAGLGEEVVLVTEMNAGWYRYIMEWRFGQDGRIRPRYGFGSTTNGCVCAPRNHHVYWRFDFDVVSPTNKVFKIERGRKFMTPVATELSIFRNYGLNRGFMIQNSASDEAYSIFPNLNDGTVTNSAGLLTDTYGAGDFWLMQFKGTSASPSELDDPNSGSAANLAPWVNGENLVNQDVVVWYSAHQYRIDDTSLTQMRDNVLSGVHVVGPDIRPIRW